MQAALVLTLLLPLVPPAEAAPKPADRDASGLKAAEPAADPIATAWAARRPGVKEGRELLATLKAAADKQPTAERLTAYARAAYWLGLQEEDAKVREKTREKTFTTCRDVAGRVQKLAPKDPGGYFWAGVCRAKIAEITGIVSSAWELPELIELMEKVDKLEPGYANGGTGRYWGTVIVRTPGFLRAMQGKDLDDAESFFKQSLKHAPEYSGTWIHIAELELKRDDEKAAAVAYDRAIKSRRARDPEVEAWNRYYRIKAKQAKRALDD